MTLLKQHLMIIVLAVVCLGSVGTAVWAYLSGDEIVEQMQKIDNLRSQVQRKSGAPNLAMIEAKEKDVEVSNAELDQRLDIVLSKQKQNSYYGKPRTTLVPNVLPELESNASAFAFKTAYQREFADLFKRMRSRDKPTTDEISAQRALMANRGRGTVPGLFGGFWMPDPPAGGQSNATVAREYTLQQVLSENPESRAAELAARECYMYVTNGAIRPHPLVESSEAPTDFQIWQAQMALWIEQDIVTALVKLNDRRASELEAKGIEPWVAHMPVKHLKVLRLEDWFGRGGGMNRGKFAPSFTGIKNDSKLFVIPIQMELVVEEASVMKVIDSLCSVGFYTPTAVQYDAVDPDPFQTAYIYGTDPVVEVTIDLEGYYFREVFDQWIPKELKPILSTPEALEKLRGGRG